MKELKGWKQMWMLWPWRGRASLSTEERETTRKYADPSSLTTEQPPGKGSLEKTFGSLKQQGKALGSRFLGKSTESMCPAKPYQRTHPAGAVGRERMCLQNHHTGVPFSLSFTMPVGSGAHIWPAPCPFNSGGNHYWPNNYIRVPPATRDPRQRNATLSYSGTMMTLYTIAKFQRERDLAKECNAGSLDHLQKDWTFCLGCPHYDRQRDFVPMTVP